MARRGSIASVPDPSPQNPPGGGREAAGTGQALRAGRAVALGVAALGLLSLVALASQGPLLRARSQDRQGHLPSWTSGLFTIALALGAVALVYGFTLARRQRQPRAMSGMWSVLVVIAGVALALVLLRGHHGHERAAAPTPPAPSVSAAPQPSSRSTFHTGGNAGRGRTWLEVFALAAGALVAIRVATRRGRPAVAGLDTVSALAALVDDSLDDLRAEADPRRAVIAAYARMERGLGAIGLTRDRADTPFEYLGRVLTDHRVSPAAATRLTGLFEQAKFSSHPVEPAAKQEAIAALEAVRDELRATRPGPQAAGGWQGSGASPPAGSDPAGYRSAGDP